ncbi:hypothetical protein E2C01_060107 [Portunus trituberculatus]|uniref:Uncharacterized protein n=1 Tax=Portunus trituberculatus TaxID=210409 RepID=A0A5B7H7U1_PORTR|nr:hypothetical protein [Portunus trituberculatus]
MLLHSFLISNIATSRESAPPEPLVEAMVIAKLAKQRGWEHKKLTYTIAQVFSGNARGTVGLTSRPNRHAIDSERVGGGTV